MLALLADKETEGQRGQNTCQPEAIQGILERTRGHQVTLTGGCAGIADTTGKRAP